MGRPPTLPTLAQARPDLVAQWDPRNTRTPETTSIGAGYAARWVCTNTVNAPLTGEPLSCRHEWTATVARRARGQNTGCPACAGKVASWWNNVAAVHPELANEWCTDNDRSPSEVPVGSAYRATWVCSVCSHRWAKPVEKRTNGGYGCPSCAGFGVTDNYNLAVLYPHLAAEWHSRNVTRPEEHRPGTPKRVWWQCHNTVIVNGIARECGHEWNQMIAMRANGYGCPACSRRRPSTWNNLTVTNPDLIGQWSERNERGPETVSRGSSVKAWWRCNNQVDKPSGRSECGHQWKAVVSARAIAGRGCPACAGHVLTEWNSFAALYPDLIAEWSESNELSPSQVGPGTDYRPTWECRNTVEVAGKVIRCGHRWKTRPSNRALLGTGCPRCTLIGTSRAEITLAAELALFYPLAPERSRVEGATKRWQADVVLRDHKFVVEYDGYIWHRDHETRDRAKTKDLEAAGWTVIRLREAPLHALSENDAAFPACNVKEAANQALLRLTEQLGYKPAGLDGYLAAHGLKNSQVAAAQIRELTLRALARRAA